jgi:PAS domain S-box-containing protein
MSQPLRVLIVEDSDNDAVLLLRTLEQAGFQPSYKQVYSVTAMQAALGQDEWDVVVSDYTMPSFSGLNALKLLQQSAIDIPFIMVSGKTGEDTAVEVMKAGAHDYILKGNLSRLGPSIERELRAAAARRERRQAEESLRKSEEKYRMLVEGSFQGIGILQARRLVFANSTLATIFGCTLTELLSLSLDELFGFVHPEDRAIVSENMRKSLSGEPIPEQSQARIIRKDGAIRWLDSFATHVEYQNRPAIQASLIDITDRKQAEQKIRRVEQRYRELFEEAPVMYVITRNQGGEPIIQDCNKLFLTTLGYPRNEVVSKPLAKFYSATARIDMLEGGGYQRALAGTFDTEARELIRCDGQIIKTLLRALPESASTGEVSGTRAMFVDVTEQQRVEEEIRRRNRELTLLNRVITASTTSLEPEVVLQTACRELALTFEVPQAVAILLTEEKTAGKIVAEYQTQNWPSLLNKTIPMNDNLAARYLLTQQAPLVVENVKFDRYIVQIYELLNRCDIASMLSVPLLVDEYAAGYLCLHTAQPRHFSPDEVNLVTMVADQVAGVVTRARMAQTQRRLSTAIEQTAESVIITDVKTRVLYVNPAFEKVTGYTSAEVIGQSLKILHSGKHDDAFYQKLWQTISAGQVWHGHFINKKKDGTLYTDEATISPVRDENGVIVSYVSVQRDVTRELELEEQYRQAQKMEAIGQLTGGIAHDFNNLLTAINGFAELTKASMSQEDPHREMVDKILFSGQRAADLVCQLSTFSRKQVIEPKILNLNTVVTELDKMLRRIIGEHILIENKLASNLGAVKVDPAQIGQVILNLAVNARDAMPEGGRLTIETDNVVLQQNEITGHLSLQPGNYVLLAVTDTGVGMSRAVQARIFEPFFTTKEQGKGTGLGLATVFGIVKQSEGNIQCYSQEGQGTTFKIYFPRIAGVAESSTRQDQCDKMPAGTETVLVVEDDPLVRELTTDTLKWQGYSVLNAVNGQKALDLVEEYQQEIHLLLTDMVMPKMNGRVLAKRLIELRPGMKVIFVSGYTDDTMIHHGVFDSEVAFLTKPFGPAQLMRKVREILDR